MTATPSPPDEGSLQREPIPFLQGWQIEEFCYITEDMRLLVNWYVYILMPDGVVYEHCIPQPCHWSHDHDIQDLR